MRFRSESYLKTVLAISSFAFLFAFIFGGMDERALSYYCQSGQLCYDTGSSIEFSVPVYTCSSGVCSLTRTEYFNCMFSPPSTCTQSPTSTPGYESYNACMGGRDYHPSECQARYPCLAGGCRGGNPRKCVDSFDCDCSSFIPAYYTCGSGSAYSGICCVDGGDPGYCLPGTCVDCTKTCNTGERLEATTCTPRSASCNKINDCTGAVCGTVTYSCYPVGTCQDCIPTAPTNYHDPLPGDNPIYNTSTCITSSTCNKSTTCGITPCGSPSTVTKTFYLNEPNTKPSPPENLIIDVDGWKSPVLSTSASSPTLIKYPYQSSSTSTSIKEVTSAPSGSGVYGWELYIGSTLITPRKVFNTTPPFNVYGSFPSISWLTQGYSGTYRAQYYTRDFCDGDEIKSDPLMGYFKVNTLPASMATITGIGGEYKGCTPEAKFTGKNVNKTLNITVTGTDADNTNSINGAILWFVKDGSNISSEIQARTYVGPSEALVDTNKFGLFINTGGTVYMTMNSGATFIGWGRNGLDGGNIVHPVMDEDRNVIISNVQLVSHGFNLATGKYEFIIRLKFPDNSPLSGHYTLYAGLTDTLSYVSIPTGMSLDQRNVTSSGKDWNFDFVNPSVGTITQVFNDQRNITLTWENSDVGSSPKSNVLNIYKSGISGPVTPTFAPDSKPDPVPNPPTIIGDINPLLSGWYYPTPTNSALINIGNNSNGTITIYPTVYDQACNRSNTSPAASLELNRWITTKGGVLFSQQNINYIPKSSANQYNLGTELISLLSFGNATVLDYGSEQNPTKVLSAIDTNYIGKGTLFEVLKERAIFYNNKYNYPVKVPPSPPDKIDFTQCTDEICVFWKDGNLTIGTDNSVTTYSGKRLVFASGNITIYPNVKATDPAMDGLIILAGGNITITGNNKNTIPASTDEIDALLLANGYISVLEGPDAELDPSIQQDALMVTGSMLALGSTNPSRAFDLRRNLGLQNPLSPVLIVHYHPKYAKISELFFGTDNKIYKQEIGYKL